MNSENRTAEYDFSKLSEPFQNFLGDIGQMFQAWDMFPMPIEIFDPNGTAIFINRSCIDMFNIKDAGLHVGKYNILHDTASDNVWGHDSIERAFRGEVISRPYKPVPIQSVVDRGVADEKPFEAAFMDVHLLPVWKGEKLAHVICICNPKQVYMGLPEVARAKEYIDSHWLDKFDAHAVAKAVNVSYSTMAPIFKQQTGMTLHDYYQQVKIDRIKEKLGDKSLTIQQVFDACGADSRGWSAKLFHKMTGMTPKEYRNTLK